MRNESAPLALKGLFFPLLRGLLLLFCPGSPPLCEQNGRAHVQGFTDWGSSPWIFPFLTGLGRVFRSPDYRLLPPFPPLEVLSMGVPPETPLLTQPLFFFLVSCHGGPFAFFWIFRRLALRPPRPLACSASRPRRQGWEGSPFLPPPSFDRHRSQLLSAPKLGSLAKRGFDSFNIDAEFSFPCSCPKELPKILQVRRLLKEGRFRRVLLTHHQCCAFSRG